MRLALLIVMLLVAALLHSPDNVIHELPVTMPTEAAFELAIGIVLFF